MGLFKKEVLKEKLESSKIVYTGDYLTMYHDEVFLPDRGKGVREYLDHPGGVGIVALDENGKIALESQYRHPFEKEIYEIPAGKLTNKQEDSLLAAKRELEEETGITADNYQYLGYLYPSVAYSKEIIHLYLATGLHFGQRHLDDDEFLNVEMVDLQEVYNLIMDNKIGDAKTIIAVLKAYNIVKNK